MTSFALAVSLFLAQLPKKDAPPTPAEQLAKVVADLKEARGLLPKVSDKATRERLELLITRSEVTAAELQKTLAARPAAPSVPSEAAFADLMASLKKNAFDEGKLNFVKSLGTKGRYTSAQAKSIMATFSFDDDRVNAGVFLYPLVVDPEKFYQAIDTCKFGSSKDDLRAKIGMK